MFYLSNSANSVLQRVLATMPTNYSEFGSRFQHLTAIALKMHPDLATLYENLAAGQPDCYCGASGHGFEIKSRSQATSVTMDDNSWRALSNYAKPRMIAILTMCPPYPLWVVNLAPMTPGPINLKEPGPINLKRDTPVDADLEGHLKVSLGNLVEALGAKRICEGTRDQFVECAVALAGSGAVA